MEVARRDRYQQERQRKSNKHTHIRNPERRRTERICIEKGRLATSARWDGMAYSKAQIQW